ncbi:MAG TPA: caspase family protein, partial [Dehalococcoidia bacterium]|nr:caspase family protein [Dehalococcoidia bacterium]
TETTNIADDNAWTERDNVSSTGDISYGPAVVLAGDGVVHVMWIDNFEAVYAHSQYQVSLPVTKDYLGCTSIYTVTNQSTSTASTMHEFFEAGNPMAVFSFTDPIGPIASTRYDLADISGLSSGFTGTVSIGSTQPITATLESCPRRSCYVYLPLVLKEYPGKYAVVVGVADYQYLNDLNYTDDDAQDFYNTLLHQCDFQSDDIKLLTNSQATKSAIQDAITNWLDTREGAQSLVVVFFSGHGGNDMPDANGDETYGGDEYICPYDSSLYSWAYDVSDDELDTWLSALESQNVVVFIDSCFSGGMIRGPQDAVSRGISKATGESLPAQAGVEGDGFARDINKPGRVVLTASSDTQYSWEFGALQNGAFTYYLVEGLQSSSADTNGNGMVSAEEAHAYLQGRVDDYVYSHTGGDYHQNPQLYDADTADDIDLSWP